MSIQISNENNVATPAETGTSRPNLAPPYSRLNRSFYGPNGKFKWAVYPDYWKDTWGKRPVLGTVWADDEFCAQREAYNRGLLIMNFTFGPKVVKLNTPARSNVPRKQ